MANLGVTVNDLYKACAEEIKNGNGDKHIVISSDDEGNTFHTLFYLFATDRETVEYCLDNEQDGTHTPENCVILG